MGISPSCFWAKEFLSTDVICKTLLFAVAQFSFLTDAPTNYFLV